MIHLAIYHPGRSYAGLTGRPHDREQAIEMVRTLLGDPSAETIDQHVALHNAAPALVDAAPCKFTTPDGFTISIQIED